MPESCSWGAELQNALAQEFNLGKPSNLLIQAVVANRVVQ